jgi:hypothetical protein
MRPVVGGAEALAGAGLALERRVAVGVLDRIDLDGLVVAAINHPRVQSAIRSAASSDGAKQAVTTVFNSGLLDEIITQLLDSDALWRMIDDIAGSPAVTAAVTQQSLGFADQLGVEVRARSRRADDWLERIGGRLTHRRQEAQLPAPAEPTPEQPTPGQLAPGEP